MDKLFEMNGFDFDEDTGAIRKYTGNEREVVVPANVREIYENAFADNEFLESVTFEGDKIIVGEYAFAGCKKLARVNVKGEFSRLEQFAFASCKVLEEIDLSGVSEIGKLALGYCSGLRRVKLTDGLKSIGEMAFGFCENLESISIPDSVEFIGKGALTECQNMLSVRLPEKLAEIPQCMFFNCCSLTEIKIPETVKTIGKFAFGACSSLVEIDLPESVEVIEEVAFAACTSLSDITIRGNVKRCGANIFEKIFELNFHLTPESCCERLVSRSTELEYVRITGKGARISDSMFHNCENLKKVVIDEGIVEIGSGAFDCCYQLSEITFPESVEKIGKLAFAFCFELEEITLPKNLKIIGDSAFIGCSELRRVDMPSAVEFIGESAFYCCRKLCEITVPESVGTVGKDAFYDCPAFCEVDFKREELSVKEKVFEEENEMYGEKVRIIGLGLVGSEAVGEMAKTFKSSEDVSVEFMVADNNSDIRKYSVENVTIRLLRTSSAPSDFELGEIRKFLDGADIAYICLGMGENSISRIVSTVCDIAREICDFTICAYTMPLVFEEDEKHKAAEEQREFLKDKVDALVEVKSKIVRGMSITQLFGKINENFRRLVQMTPAVCDKEKDIFIELDDFRDMLRGAKNARFVTETVQGEDKIRVLSQIVSAIIPENTSRVVAHFSCFANFTISDLNELCESIKNALREDASFLTSVAICKDEWNSVSLIECE